MSITGINSSSDHYNVYDSNEAEDVTRIVLKYRDSNNQPPLVLAAEAGDLHAVRQLLVHGANPQEALRGAVRGQQHAVLKYLLEDLGLVCESPGWYHYWTGGRFDGLLDVLDYLLNHGTALPPLEAFFATPSIYTPQIIEALIKRGGHFSKEYSAAWHYQISIFSSSFDVVLRRRLFECLTVEANAPVNQYFKIYDQNRRTLVLCTPLLFAVITNDIELARSLLRLHADPDAPCEGIMPLRQAISQDNEAMMTLLIQYGAKISGI